MKFQVLISTMFQNDETILDKMNIQSDVVVINQCNDESKRTFYYKQKYLVLWINTKERGLSKSRNMAINNSCADYLLIADDDEIFVDNYIQLISKSIDENPYYSIYRFKIEGIEKEFKQYPKKNIKIGFLKALKVSSVEIVIDRKCLLKNKIKFNELIGSGTPFLMGEESALLYSCLRKKMKIIGIPCKIADLHMDNSTWFTGFNEKYFVGKGAAFEAMSHIFSIPLMIQFCIRKRNVDENEYSIMKSFKMMLTGRKEYLKQTRKESK